MPERDYLKEEANQSFSDQVLEIGSTAAAIGAAAVAVYRAGGNHILSRGISRYAPRINSVLRSIKELDYYRTDIESLKELHKELRNPGNVSLGPDVLIQARAGTNTEALQRAFEMMETENNLILHSIRRNGITLQLQDIAKQTLARRAKLVPGLNVKEEEKRLLQDIHRMMQDFNKDATSYEIPSIDKILSQRGMSPVRRDIIRETVDNARRLMAQEEKLPYQSVESQIVEKILDPAAMKKNVKENTFLDKILGDHAATIRDILNAYRKDPSKIQGFQAPIGKQAPESSMQQRSFDFLEKLNRYMNEMKEKDLAKHDALMNVRLDPFIRVGRNGELNSFTRFAGIGNDIVHTLASSMPGKILRLRDLGMSSAVPILQHTVKGSIDLAIAAIEGAPDKKHTQNDYFRIYDRIYRYDAATNQLKDAVKENEAFGNLRSISARFGAGKTLYRSMGGLNPERRNESYILNLLGLNSSPTLNFWEGFTKGTEDPNNVHNILRNITREVTTEENYMERVRQLQTLNRFLEASTRGFDESIVNILDQMPNDKIEKGILDLLRETDSHVFMNKILTDKVISDVGTTEGIFNDRLSKLIKDYASDPFRAESKVKMDRDVSGAYYDGANVGLNFEEQLRKELSREYILRVAKVGEDVPSDGLDTVTRIKEFLEQSDLSIEQQRRVKDFAYASLIDYEADSVLAEHHKNLFRINTREDVIRSISVYEKYIRGDAGTPGAREAQESINNLVKDSSSDFFHRWRDTSEDLVGEYIQNDYVYLTKSTGPLDLIQSINESIKADSIDPARKTFTDFFTQFFAGRDNFQNVTASTMVPYFILHRLGADDLPAFLRFSSNDTKSFASLTAAIAKRLAPVAIGVTYLEWADDTVGAITGTRASADIVNAFANTDLFLRRVADATGFSGFMDEQMTINPFLQYWGGKDGFYDYDEELYYYANGYEPVRKGRYWKFGSVNEFRGSQIQYFQPNLTRRLNSDYYNKSLYSGYWDKWAHSLLPTPAAPFSPLIYMMDPYYLENEHSEDRPYPLTAPMFSQNTPWGIILNPTLGELIKPIRPMHQDRLQDGVDVKAIIYDINKHIRDVAGGGSGPYSYGSSIEGTDNGFGQGTGQGGYYGDHAYTIVFDREHITAGEFTPLSSPAPGETHIRFGKTRGEEMRERQNEVLGSPLEPEKRKYVYGDASQYSETGSPLDLLGQMNRQIKATAAANSGAGVLTGDRIRYSRIENYIEHADDINDLLTASKGYELIQESATSLRLLAGIYGYGANRFFGFGENDGRIIANAGDIDSFSRSFWDESIGGIGGGASEIARRFIPEFRRNIRWNPLMNTMPDWLPENLRVGDPYTIPKGEARLPGKGYESLNPLHSDEFGMYGAFDRYKILADVAPNSAEFKVWKQIAQETVKDPALIREMGEIQARVNEANKTHDFYDYMVLGQNVDYQEAIIREVHKDGTFRIQGSDELYKLAGIDTKAAAENRNVDRFQTTEEQKDALGAMTQYLHPGLSVTIATDSNKYHRNNPDAFDTVNAAVFVDGESVSEALIEEHSDIFTKKTTKFNAADTYALAGPFHRAIAGTAEFLSHMDLPLIHDRWLRVRTPYESYLAEQVYGTPYQTWGDVLGTFVFPAMERSVSDHWDVIKSTAMYFAIMAAKNQEGIGLFNKKALSGMASVFDRGAFIGGAISYFFFPNNGKVFERGQRIGSLATVVGNLYTSTQSGTFDAAASWAEVGYMIGDILDTSKKEFIKEKDILKRIFRTEESLKMRGKFALGGALAGIAARGMLGDPVYNDRDRWIPDRVRKKWELEDYFDRLEYIKYMGLYHKAAALAKSEEGVDIEQIFRDHEEFQEKRAEIMEESNIMNDSQWKYFKRNVSRYVNELMGRAGDNQNHRFEYANGFSINDLPGVRNGVFHSDEISEEERLYTLNALVTMGIYYASPGTARTNDDRDLTQVSTAFEHAYGIKIPDYYQVHHIVQFSKNGPDDPSNLIALHPDDHLYITEAHERYYAGQWAAEKIGARTAMRLGEYGRSALLYKKAAESTMYGLEANARWTDVVKSLPKYERDYFIEFMKEHDPEEQEKILSVASPFLRRALKQVWHMDYEKEKGPSNEEYFQEHNLPGFMWEGWRPDSDINKVKAKTIKNEGMLFSDFGIYESQYRDQEVINAPNLSPRGSQDPITLQTNLAATLNGLGLAGVDVSVEPKSTKGIQSIINLTKVINYKVGETVDELFSF